MRVQIRRNQGKISCDSEVIYNCEGDEERCEGGFGTIDRGGNEEVYCLMEKKRLDFLRSTILCLKMYFYFMYQ